MIEFFKALSVFMVEDLPGILGGVVYYAVVRSGLARVTGIKVKLIWRDKTDAWSLGHTLATIILARGMQLLGLHVWSCALLAWLLMFLYELIVDGYTISDPEGFSATDIVFNTYGAILALVLL